MNTYRDLEEVLVEGEDEEEKNIPGDVEREDVVEVLLHTDQLVETGLGLGLGGA